MIRHEGMLKEELKTEQTTAIRIYTMLHSPEVESLIPNVYLDSTNDSHWWRHLIRQLVNQTHGKNHSLNLYCNNAYRTEFGIWKLVEKRCQKCNNNSCNDNQNVRVSVFSKGLFQLFTTKKFNANFSDLLIRMQLARVM